MLLHTPKDKEVYSKPSQISKIKLLGKLAVKLELLAKMNGGF